MILISILTLLSEKLGKVIQKKRQQRREAIHGARATDAVKPLCLSDADGEEGGL